jgi:nuclear GTP-binding protein
MKQKYAQERKSKEQITKLKKEARKLKKVGFRRNLKKDIGIPNICPFKKDLLEDLQRKKETEERISQIKRLQAREVTKKQEYENLVASAQSRGMTYEETEHQEVKTGVDSSRRAYYKDLLKVIEDADVLLEVLDARDPEAYRSQELEHKILSYGNKRLVLVLNKIDLVPRQNALEWHDYLSQSLPVLLFRSNLQNQASRLGRATLFKNSLETEMAGDMLDSSKALGVEALMSLLKNYMRTEQGGERAITVGVVGCPNVGKSSVINSLKRARAVGVSSQPGFTKGIQEVEIESKIKILDSPGVVFSNTSNSRDDPSLILRNVVKIENISDPFTPTQAILTKVDKQQLLMLYAIPDFEDIVQFLGHISRKRGKLKKGGVPDFDAAAKIVLHDWVTGKLQYFTPVPSSRMDQD